MVKLLKSGRVPEERQGTDRRHDRQARNRRRPGSSISRRSSTEASRAIRVKALEALAEAAANRSLKPAGDLDKLIALCAGAASSLGAAAGRSRRSGWRASGSSRRLPRRSRRSPGPRRRRRSRCESAIDALATIGGKAGPVARSRPSPARDPRRRSRLLAIAALARLDVDAAAARAAESSRARPAGGADLQPLLAAFLNRQGGGAILAAAIGRQPIPPDAAKLALRAVYSLGQADPALVDRAWPGRGHRRPRSSRSPPPSSTPWSPKSPPRATRRAARPSSAARDLNCMSCHSVSKAGGDVGPDLSAVGQTSPPDYIINSILIPTSRSRSNITPWSCSPSTGQVFQGIVTDKDDQRVVLKDATGATARRPGRLDRGPEDRAAR